MLFESGKFSPDPGISESSFVCNWSYNCQTHHFRSELSFMKSHPKLQEQQKIIKKCILHLPNCEMLNTVKKKQNQIADPSITGFCTSQNEFCLPNFSLCVTKKKKTQPQPQKNPKSRQIYRDIEP